MGRSIGITLVAVAAAMWGLDAWIRKPLAQSTAVGTIVFGEHLVLVLCTLPFLFGALATVFRLGWRYVLAAVVIGAGSSAIATILFTQAFVDGDPVTPVVLQKVQPVIAVIAARIILGERPRPRFALYLVPALVGTWLIGVNHPLHPTAQGLKPMLLALGAAVLWALGTVLGRYLGRALEFQHILSLRFFFGLVGSAAGLLVWGGKAYAGAHDSLWIAYLAVVTGLLALALYYFGLKRTPAVLASLAELTYPAIAVIAGIYAYNSHLRWTQWVGVVAIIATVSLLPVQRRRKMVKVPAPAPSPA